ncbi:hypothetical protein BDN72DRAFT_769922 [Pluteus cervinus]|uniref:Uncharacterized protein n=1 Tax=Pluteus cervinus TaxID=181527 RepID=A0ACD3AT28_9AGAR|nr:hypothetical protein BDN72DRAFT_769922 [Pluteus cervinus]
MHFAKTFAQLLLDLPPEFRENAVQYRQLKKLINQVVTELSSIGLNPTVLHELIEAPSTPSTQLDSNIVAPDGVLVVDQGLAQQLQHDDDPDQQKLHLPRIVYDFSHTSGKIEPRLRVWLPVPKDASSLISGRTTDISEPERPEPMGGEQQDEPELVGETEEGKESEALIAPNDSFVPLVEYYEMIIPLVSDTTFFQSLSTALEGLSTQLVSAHQSFVHSLEGLAATIGDAARPVSSLTHFHAYSGLTSHPGLISVHAPRSASHKNDLYSWREIFQLYVEAEVFENVHEVGRGERSLEDSETRLRQFVERITQRGLTKKRLKNQASADGLKNFLELNLFILNIKKYQFANAEATRKILKKHAKRTALPFVLQSQEEHGTSLILPLANATSLPRIFVQAVGEILLPIIPHIDDYACLICLCLAFKPIRLGCGHLFCVRCLVKMQKQGKGNCPMCRAPTVLVANRSNVDWALINFMQDWFPLEAKEKLKANEKEATRESLKEMGVDPDEKCIIC